MLIHLYGKIDEGSIKFDQIPSVGSYGRTDEYTTISVREVLLTFSKATSNFNGVLVSPMIDKSTENPRQQLYHFYQKEKGKYYHEKPTCPIAEMIYTYRFNFEDWSIESENTDAVSIYLLLEIN